MTKSSLQRGQRFSFDVVVIGSGIAGLIYSVELLKRRPKTRLALVSKAKLGHSNSELAQGGIAAATSDADIQSHIKDTSTAGDGLCSPEVLEAILSEGPESIHCLQNYGILFDTTDSGQLARGQEAGHACRRIYHVADHTGRSIITALVEALRRYASDETSSVTCFEYSTAVNLIVSDEKARCHQKRCIGVYVLSEASELIHTVMAKQVVLATGGAGKVYQYTSNSPLATGDGVAMAWRAGARIGGMEFYQFHPTLLYHAKEPHFLISEALRGEGAYLCAPKGKRFMQHYAPEKMELATRDIVSRAIFQEIERNGAGHVCLDCRHLESQFLQKRFPVIYHTLFALGLDMQRDLIPVVPAAHYMGGGILADISGQTDIANLFAIGETAFTGFHGANRLASNSLLEGVVMGRKAAKQSAVYLDSKEALQASLEWDLIPDWDSGSVVDLRRASQINAHWQGLRGEMTSYAGIIRTAAGLRDQLKLVEVRRRIIEKYYWKYQITRDLIELRNISLVAELIIRCALLREESRGGHYREDYPDKSSHHYDTILRASEMKTLFSK